MSYIRNYFNKLSYDQKGSLRVIKNSFWKINWIKTLWFNCKTLPFSKAIRCPVIIAYNTKIKNVGKIVFTNDIYPAMVSLGVIRLGGIETTSNPLVFNNRGTLEIGGRLKIHPGAVFSIVKGATIKVGNCVGFGANSKVICRKSITIANNVQCSWNTQILDSDFHFLYNIEKDKYYPRTKDIIIGNNVFIGNGCTIGKGTILPDGCVVSCISKVSGDFTTEGENLLISGNPAKVIKKGVNISSGWFPEKEKEIAKLMKE